MLVQVREPNDLGREFKDPPLTGRTCRRKRLNTRRRRGPAGYEVAEKGLLLVNSAQTSVQVRTGVYSACTSTTDRQGVACVCPAGTTRSVCTNTADSQRVTCVYVAHTSKLGGRTRPVRAAPAQTQPTGPMWPVHASHARTQLIGKM